MGRIKLSTRARAVRLCYAAPFIVALVTVMAMLIAPPIRAMAGEPGTSRPTDFRAIDAYVQNEMARAASPGLAYAIVHGDQIVHLNAFGIADPGGRAVRPQTPFIIGSVGKTFTALAIRQLVNAGRIHPNAPAQMYIPWFRVTDPQSSAHITVQQLLDHTSGIPHWAGNQLYQLDERSTLEVLVRRAETIQLKHEPGTAFEYSNVNFLILGLIVEQVSGQSYAEYVQQHILAPLGMVHTYLDEHAAEADGLATGYQSWFGLFLPIHAPYPHGMQPAGYSISTAEDLGHYLVAYLNDGRSVGASLLAHGATSTPGSRSHSYYDIYWNERPLTPDILEGQSGGTLNYNADILIQPNEKWGVVVLMNSRWTLDGLVPTVTAASIAEGVALRVVDEAPPSIPMAFQQWYLLIDTVLLTLVLFALYEIVRVWKWYRSIRATGVTITLTDILALVIDLAVALGLVGLPISQELALDYFLFTVPDIAMILYAVAIVLFAVVIARTAILIAPRPTTAMTHDITA